MNMERPGIGDATTAHITSTMSAPLIGTKEANGYIQTGLVIWMTEEIRMKKYQMGYTEDLPGYLNFNTERGARKYYLTGNVYVSGKICMVEYREVPLGGLVQEAAWEQ